MTQAVDPQLVDFLASTSGLTESACQRLILEVLAQYQETLDEFVRRRHQELKHAEGMKNQQIYECIGQELQERRFSAPTLSERQIRRIIYG